MRTYAIKALQQIEASAAGNIWDAHHGCAAIAGALLISRHLVDDESKPLIESHVESLLPSTIHYSPITGPIPLPGFRQSLLDTLAAGATDAKELGHDVIYSAYVLKALDHFQIEPWESLLEAITTLVRKIKQSGPGWITINGKNEFLPLSDSTDEVTAPYWETFARFDRPLSMETGDMQLGHLLTHGHAIGMLAQFAISRLISDLHTAYEKRVHTLRLANARERDCPPPLRSSAAGFDPRTKNYWELMGRLGDMHGHVLKYAFSFLDLKEGRISATDLESFSRVVWPGQ